MEHCDTILVIPNERLLEIEGVKDLPLVSAFFRPGTSSWFAQLPVLPNC